MDSCRMSLGVANGVTDAHCSGDITGNKTFAAAPAVVLPLDEIALACAGLNGGNYTENPQLAYYLSLLRLVALVGCCGFPGWQLHGWAGG